MNDSDDGRRPGLVDPDALMWRKSSFSIEGACVGLANFQGGIGVRNTNRPDAGVLFLTRDQLAGWIADIKAGALDDLT